MGMRTEDSQASLKRLFLFFVPLGLSALLINLSGMLESGVSRTLNKPAQEQETTA
jgi:hypothetical protein